MLTGCSSSTPTPRVSRRCSAYRLRPLPPCRSWLRPFPKTFRTTPSWSRPTLERSSSRNARPRSCTGRSRSFARPGPRVKPCRPRGWSGTFGTARPGWGEPFAQPLLLGLDRDGLALRLGRLLDGFRGAVHRHLEHPLVGDRLDRVLARALGEREAPLGGPVPELLAVVVLLLDCLGVLPLAPHDQLSIVELDGDVPARVDARKLHADHQVTVAGELIARRRDGHEPA